MSLTDKYNLIVEAALDSLSETLGIDCSWIQLANPASNDLHLASFRNFTPEIHHEMAQMDMNHYFAKEVVGLRNTIMIPRLSKDSGYLMEVFRKAGFSSLIAVPITTYKVLGIMGAAYRKRKRFSNDFSELFIVIANLVGMALNKNTIIEHTIPSEDSRQSHSRLSMNTNNKGDTEEGISIIDEKVIINNNHIEDRQEAFQKHAHKMGEFRKSHNRS